MQRTTQVNQTQENILYNLIMGSNITRFFIGSIILLYFIFLCFVINLFGSEKSKRDVETFYENNKKKIQVVRGLAATLFVIWFLVVFSLFYLIVLNASHMKQRNEKINPKPLINGEGLIGGYFLMFWFLYPILIILFSKKNYKNLDNRKLCRGFSIFNMILVIILVFSLVINLIDQNNVQSSPIQTSSLSPIQ